jgi:hypothetical protein
MTALKSNRKDDKSEQLPESLLYDGSRWLGTWYNTYDETRHISRLEILERDTKLCVRVFGAGEPEPFDWGLAELALFNSNISTHHAEGFTTTYDFGYCETHLAGLEKQNVLVISTYTTFKDGSKRHNYYLREFYFKK